MTQTLTTTAVRRRDLHEGWELTLLDGPAPFAVREVPATVPGTLITDLHAAGLIEDPYLDRHEHDLADRRVRRPTRPASTGRRRRRPVDLVAPRWTPPRPWC